MVFGKVFLGKLFFVKASITRACALAVLRVDCVAKKAGVPF